MVYKGSAFFVQTSILQSSELSRVIYEAQSVREIWPSFDICFVRRWARSVSITKPFLIYVSDLYLTLLRWRYWFSWRQCNFSVLIISDVNTLFLSSGSGDWLHTSCLSVSSLRVSRKTELSETGLPHLSWDTWPDMTLTSLRILMLLSTIMVIDLTVLSACIWYSHYFSVITGSIDNPDYIRKFTISLRNIVRHKSCEKKEK